MKLNSEHSRLAGKCVSGESAAVLCPLWFLEVQLAVGVHCGVQVLMSCFAFTAPHVPLPCWGCVLHDGKLQGKRGSSNRGLHDMTEAHIQFSALGILASAFHHYFSF